MKVLLLGAKGRLGHEIGTVLKARGHEVQPLGRGDSETALPILQAQNTPYVFLDVSLPQGTLVWARCFFALNAAQRALCQGILIGTTGFQQAELKELESLDGVAPWCLVSNFSAGVHLFEELLSAKTQDGRTVAELARGLGFDLSLWESHHTRKLDAPSGTAKTLAQAAGIPVDRIAATRVGHVVGEHVVFASAEGEELRIQHIAHTRVLFARGASLMAERMAGTSLPPHRHSKAQILNLPQP